VSQGLFPEAVELAAKIKHLTLPPLYGFWEVLTNETKMVFIQKIKCWLGFHEYLASMYSNVYICNHCGAEIIGDLM
jgi:hypothetical protein